MSHLGESKLWWYSIRTQGTSKVGDLGNEVSLGVPEEEDVLRLDVVVRKAVESEVLKAASHVGHKAGGAVDGDGFNLSLPLELLS